MSEKISDEDQSIRQSLLIDRGKEIEQASNELVGAWSMWRTIMNKKYNLADKDIIEEDGTINRVEKKDEKKPDLELVKQDKVGVE